MGVPRSEGKHVCIRVSREDIVAKPYATRREDWLREVVRRTGTIIACSLLQGVFVAEVAGAWVSGADGSKSSGITARTPWQQQREIVERIDV